MLLRRIFIKILCIRPEIFVKKKPYLRLANKILRWAKEHRHWTEELCLEGHKHPGVASSLLILRLVFCGYCLWLRGEE
jgi:hypothetical protein